MCKCKILSRQPQRHTSSISIKAMKPLLKQAQILHSLFRQPHRHVSSISMKLIKPAKSTCKYYMLSRQPHKHISRISMKAIKPPPKTNMCKECILFRQPHRHTSTFPKNTRKYYILSRQPYKQVSSISMTALKPSPKTRTHDTFSEDSHTSTTTAFQ